jgi:Fe-Mn family superoxide dismutase
LKLAALGAAGLITAPFGAVLADENDFSRQFSPFLQKKLPYEFDALEPYVDKMTMEIHFGKHHAGYVSNLNKALESEKELQNLTIERLMPKIGKETAPAIRNNGGGHFNHEFFWEILSPKTEQVPSANLSKAIEANFQSFENFKSEFSKAALGRFGSGWAWLCRDTDGKLFITSTPNQDNPLMSLNVEKPGIPLLGIDVWEHAYYLKYQNRRSEYVEAFFKIINWELVSKKFES